jgi:hypothetical protein
MSTQEINTPELKIKSTESYPIEWFWEIHLNGKILCKSEHSFESEKFCRTNLILLNTCVKYFNDNNLIKL